MLSCVLIRQLLPELERECVSPDTPHGRQMLLWRALGSSLLQCSVGKGTFLAYLCQTIVFLGAKPSAPILWKLMQEIVYELRLLGWAISESRLGMRKEWLSWSHPIYFIIIYINQRVCVCNFFLMKSSDRKNHLVESCCNNWSSEPHLTWIFPRVCYIEPSSYAEGVYTKS